MVFGDDQHALNSATGTLLAEHHLKDRRVDGLARDLTTKHVQFAVGDFEVCGGVFVLCVGYHVSDCNGVRRSGVPRTSVCFFAFGDKMMLSVGRAFCDSSGVAA